MKKLLTIRLEESDIKKLKKLAEIESKKLKVEITPSNLIRYWIRNRLPKNIKKRN